ncbi:MAG: CDP-alcohol phosphatidyltransferase family protein [Acidobacteriia bacterium]|nr:CDP-alcohol phosphatidyltransferase family protein [Terriglobia bacterium]
MRSTIVRVGFKQEKRVQESFSAAGERKALNWLATRLPAWVNSDRLTVLGSLGMMLGGGSYALARWHAWGLLGATFFLAVNWFGDSLDGTLARLRHCQRPRYGFYVDHLLDSFGALFLMAGLALSGYVNPWIAMGMLVAFLLLSIEVYLTTYTLGSFRLSYGRLGPTEMRMALALGNLALFFRGNPRVLGGRFLLLDVGGIIGIAGMTIVLLISAATHIAQLYREERLP